MLPKTILVPTDLGEGSEAALDYACELASKLDATVHVLNVIGIPAMGVPELGVAITANVMDSLVVENQAAVDRLLAARAGSVKVGQAWLRTGDAVDEIGRVAREISADLIVMSTHGRRGVSRLLVGSIAESVVRSAPCPVLAVREHDEHLKRDAA